ncbi:MAG: nucleoside-diphosphate sugar epimerase/dehydratase [Pseudomonadota bacterium]|nr:nucleoside-diphosphate sugar epimerase/dehydratase [Pseudomonadota bacterium]
MRGLITLFYDAIIGGAALYLALLLRFGGEIPATSEAPLYAVPYAIICLITFGLLGMQRRMWRYTSTSDAVALSYAVALSIMVTASLMFTVTRLEHFPRTAFPILLMLHVALSMFPRFIYKRMSEKKSGVKRTGQKPKNALVIGTGGAADLFLKDVQRQSSASYKILGILDDDKGKQNRLMHGVRILGAVAQLEAVLNKLDKSRRRIDMLILSEPGLTLNKTILEVAQDKSLLVKRLPSLQDMQDGEKLSNLKPVMIEDLLRRKPVQLDDAALESFVAGKRVLITGAGGSIGSEICRQIAMRNPQHITLLDHSEYALYGIDMELSRKFPEVKKSPVLANVRERTILGDVFKEGQFDVVFHAAAYKHVPLVEANAISGVATNMIGTSHVADLCAENGVESMVIISTDKAVNPTNVMGATKRAAELYCQNHEGKTNYVTVRFGNVLGSTGSVVPLFQKQIREGGPVTITHKDMTRYFMTIPEAVQLVIQAAALEIKEQNPIYMLNMGDPVRIYDLAEDMIRLSGLEVGRDIEIKEVGLRPGEKLFEELSYDSETMVKTAHKDIFCVNPVSLDTKVVKAQCEAVKKACEIGDVQGAVDGIMALVEEYTPAENSPYYKPQNETKAS